MVTGSFREGLCEKHNLPGGFVTSFVRGRFEFEASLHEFNGIGTPEQPGSTRELFEKLGVADKIEWIQLKDAYHLISREEGYDYVMPFGYEAFAKANNMLHPEGERYIREFFALCEEIRNAIKTRIETFGNHYIEHSAQKTIREYRENCPHTIFRIVKRRVPNAKQ